MPAQSKGTLVVFGGYIEEWLPAGLFFRDAGYDTILFESPGQGAALELAHLPMSPEWEKPVKTVLDFFRRDAVTLMGFSLGGGLVIRAAAFEPRVRRVIAYDICTNAFVFLRIVPPPGAIATATRSRSPTSASRARRQEQNSFRSTPRRF